MAVRWQSGFFGAEALGYFSELFDRLSATDGVLHIIIGSNDGTTKRSDVEVLLGIAGPPRKHRLIGVVAFDNAYFHPKTFHFARSDGSEAAYVGSANLTRSGATSLHVEAGLILDTHDGDDPDVLSAIRDAVDWWFSAAPDGFAQVSDVGDLDDLVAQGRLDVPRPPLVRPVAGKKASNPAAGVHLTPLVPVPPLPVSAPGVAAPAADEAPAESVEPSGEQVVSTAPRPSATPTVTTVEWTKPLSQSDAQRKPRGNQRGSITLVAAGHPINAQTYFRYDFFRGVDWVTDTTSTGEERETAVVPFATFVLGQDIGVLDMRISYAPNREASQANYTTLLHVGPLGPLFDASDMTGHELRLERRADETFALTIL